MAALSIGFRPSVRPRQLEIRADPKFLLPLSVRYSVIADGRRSCRSSRPHGVPSFLVRASNYRLSGLT